jgi:hypothetical protein
MLSSTIQKIGDLQPLETSKEGHNRSLENMKKIMRVVDLLKSLDMCELKINKFRIAMEKSTKPIEGYMLMIRMHALEWVQGRIQDLVINKVTRDLPVYNK